MDNKEVFLQAINHKKIVKIKVNTYEKGEIIRNCIPFDFGPSRKYKDGLERYHFWDLDSPDKKHNLSIIPEQLISIEITDNDFNPGDYISWKINWIIPRNWGDYS